MPQHHFFEKKIKDMQLIADKEMFYFLRIKKWGEKRPQRPEKNR